VANPLQYPVAIEQATGFGIECIFPLLRSEWAAILLSMIEQLSAGFTGRKRLI
jgi:hypothetical protein